MNPFKTVFGALSRGSGVRAGSWYILETAEETTLDRICVEVERAHGHVLSIQEYNAPPRTGTAHRAYRRIFIVTIAIPD